MSKKILLFVLSFFICILCASCGKLEKESNIVEKINKQLSEMESYYCEAKLVRVSNKGETSYETKQWYKTTGEYKLELLSPDNVAGNCTIFNGSKIYQYNPAVNDKVVIDVKSDDKGNELFLGQFVKNYFKSENVSMEVSTFANNNHTVLEAVIPGGDKYLSTEKLYIDNDTLKPIKFIIYDSNGDEKYVVTYSNFLYNEKFDDSLFNI